MTFLLVAVFGGVGAATRFVVDGLLRAARAHVLPVATMTINVTGSLLIGLLAGAHLWHGLPVTWQTVAASGFCGGYTTFSTAMVETVRLIQAGEHGRAVVNVAGTLVLAVGAAALGVAIMAVTA